MTSLNLVAFDGELNVDAGDDDLVLVVCEAKINHKHIAVFDAAPIIESPLASTRNVVSMFLIKRSLECRRGSS